MGSPKVLFRLALYDDGMIWCQGKQPDDLGAVLRILAEAADAGKIKWM